MNIFDILIIIGITAFIVLAAVYYFKKRKNGCPGGCTGCQNCDLKDQCHKKK